jgi:hypothetical protein
VLSQKLTSPDVTGEPPDVTEAVRVTKVPHDAVLTDEPPAAIDSAVVLEPPGDRIVTGSCVLATRAPDVPVMVAFAVPGCAELAAVSVRTLPVADEVGFQLAAIPEGKPAMEKLTLPLNPLSGLTATDEFSEPPGRTVMLPGAGTTVNDGVFTVTVIVVDAVVVPEVPVIVTVEVPGVAELLAAKVMYE